jgi:rod shape-determining protein MreC
VAVYRRAARARFVLLVLVLTAITLVTLDARGYGGGLLERVRSRAQDTFAPVQDATHSALRPVGDFFTGVLHYGDVKRENARLRDQLAAVRGQQDQAAASERELQLLLDQQHLAFVGQIPTVAAEVVDASSSNFELSVQVNRGTDNGVAVGMPVVASAGLVGRVVEVSAGRATVLLLTDPTFSVGVRLTTTGDTAVANGTGRGSPMRVDLVDPRVKIAPGNILVTSGLQLERFPKDIPVGTVHGVKDTPGALQQTVSLDPAVDLGRLEFVQILQWSPQG